jgi:L-rhamnose mutarotase
MLIEQWVKNKIKITKVEYSRTKHPELWGAILALGDLKGCIDGGLFELENNETAFKVWFEAYSKNYGNTALMDSKAIAQQAWQAALNYASQELEGKTTTDAI